MHAQQSASHAASGVQAHRPSMQRTAFASVLDGSDALLHDPPARCPLPETLLFRQQMTTTLTPQAAQISAVLIAELCRHETDKTAAGSPAANLERKACFFDSIRPGSPAPGLRRPGYSLRLLPLPLSLVKPGGAPTQQKVFYSNSER